jgi:hypothetical protein
MKNKGNVDGNFSISEIAGKSSDFDLYYQNKVYGPPYGFEPPFLFKDIATELVLSTVKFCNSFSHFFIISV